MNPEQAFQKLCQIDDEFSDEAFQFTLAHPEKMTPILLEALSRTHKDTDCFSENYLSTLFALFLLAIYKEKAACPLSIALFSMPKEFPWDEIWIGLLERGGCIIASVYDGRIEPIMNLALDESVDPLFRKVALDALAVLFKQNVVVREEFVSYYRHIMNTMIERKNCQMLAYCICELLDAHVEELFDEALDAFKKGNVDTDIVSLEDFQSESVHPTVMPYKFQLVKNIFEELEIVENTIEAYKELN